MGVQATRELPMVSNPRAVYTNTHSKRRKPILLSRNGSKSGWRHSLVLEVGVESSVALVFCGTSATARPPALASVYNCTNVATRASSNDISSKCQLVFSAGTLSVASQSSPCCSHNVSLYSNTYETVARHMQKGKRWATSLDVPASQSAHPLS